MTKFATFHLYISLPLILLGCQSRGPREIFSARAEIRYRIFEVSRELAETVARIPSMAGLQDIPYSVAKARETDVAALLAGMYSKPGLLKDGSRKVSSWPYVSNAWTYGRPDRDCIRAGTGGGSLGVRSINRIDEIKIYYEVSHTIDHLEPMRGRLIYEGPLPEQGYIVFLSPYVSHDRREIVHVILFEITNWKRD